MSVRFFVDQRTAGRADKAVAARFPHVGRRRIAELFARGAVRVDGKRKHKGDFLTVGQEVVLSELPQDHAAVAPVPEPDIELSVLHEDRDIVACQKPGGMPSHPLRPDDSGTLANALVARFPECVEAGADAREAGLVHRLDAGTSGVIVAARHPRAWRTLRRAFTAREVHKRYLALVAPAIESFEAHQSFESGESGEFGKFGKSGESGESFKFGESGESGESRAPLVQRGPRVVVAPDTPRALTAHTEWRLLERYASGYCLVECTARTGRMHQVRVHLAHAGAPIVGDTLYGGRALPSVVTVGDNGGDGGPMAGFFLHACALTFSHPGTGTPMTLEAPLPADRQSVLDRLG